MPPIPLLNLDTMRPEYDFSTAIRGATFHTPVGDRIKRYEATSRMVLIPHMPTIIRIDGKCFHSFTEKIGCAKPFDTPLRQAFVSTMFYLMADVMQNAVFAYHQSDEMSFLLKDWPDINTEQWFGGNIQKIASVSASGATAFFNKTLATMISPTSHLALFDARVFQLPFSEVVNYFICRQKDWERNSLQMLARFYFSHKQLEGKSCQDIHNMLHDTEVNWNDCEPWQKRGTAARKEPIGGSMLVHSETTPIFTQDRKFIEEVIWSSRSLPIITE